MSRGSSLSPKPSDYPELFWCGEGSEESDDVHVFVQQHPCRLPFEPGLFRATAIPFADCSERHIFGLCLGSAAKFRGDLLHCATSDVIRGIYPPVLFKFPL